MALEGLNSLINGLENQASWRSQQQFRRVLQHWPKAVGFAVARKTRPISIQQGTLYVAAATAAWAQTLSYERLNILRKLNQHQLLPLKNIRFSSAQWTQQTTQTAADRDAGAIAKLSNEISQHPSDVSSVPNLPPQPTADDAFWRWAQIVQQMQRSQALCTRCRCHCPQGELDRWGICALCAAKQWH
jgi:predicted nucleic acid-binding Zn ribbon protein